MDLQICGTLRTDAHQRECLVGEVMLGKPPWLGGMDVELPLLRDRVQFLSGVSADGGRGIKQLQ